MQSNLELVNYSPITIVRSEDNLQYFTGYAINWYNPTDKNTEYKVGANIFERIDSHAFDAVLNSDIELRYNHSPEFVLAQTKDGSLKIEKDNVGIKFSCLFDDTDPDHIKVQKKIQKGIVKGCSFHAEGMTSKKKEANYFVRTIDKISNWKEISIVNAPAYKSTNAIIRDVDLWRQTQEKLAKYNK